MMEVGAAQDTTASPTSKWSSLDRMDKCNDNLDGRVYDIL